MELFLSKFAWTLVQPIGLVLMAMLVSAIALFRARRRISLIIMSSAILLLWSAASPFFARMLAATLESPYPPRPAMEFPQVDAIVVLGGGVESATAPRIDVEMGEGADRLRLASQLYRAGKAPVVVASGGTLPWSHVKAPEAAAMAILLRDWGVPDAAIITESRSRNTQENAAYTARLLRQRGARRVLLVTSALHMRRALVAFSGIGVETIPAAADIHVVHTDQYHAMDFLPRAEALLLTSSALREYAGLAYYRWADASR